MIRAILLNILVLLASCYFSYHLILGQKGYIQYLEAASTFEEKARILQEIEAKRAIIEHRVGLFQPSSLDLDAVDEFARKNLGTANSGEFIVPIKIK
jgi:cell division protein FtsB